MNRNRFSLRCLFAAALALVGVAVCAGAKPFTLPVLPDTQIEVRANLEMFQSQMNWLAGNREKLD